jgi:S1-C subfamily serine protease
MTNTLARGSPAESAALDAYSQVIVSVAEQLTPRVAALQVSRRRRDGSVAASAGSAVVFTNDGFLLTNAHVVGRAEAGSGRVRRRDDGSVPGRWQRPPFRPCRGPRRRSDSGPGPAG